MNIHTSTPGEPPRLGPLETQVMDVLWDHGPSTIRGIIDDLPNDPAYTTIATVLTHLQRKGLVSSRKERHSTQYAARIGREEQVASVMNHALGTSRDRAASILHFVEAIPDSDLELLREYLRRRDDGQRS
ncbi:MAG: BlaI/MecI/CopY family transcriptional regulator [Nocardioides sp.]|uniref:BlaI/MecI/CopY family transcriptional regulator n=1 Tax=Nocardioides sp. TaxID=35761 RepID=UPI003D6AEFB2